MKTLLRLRQLAISAGPSALLKRPSHNALTSALAGRYLARSQSTTSAAAPISSTSSPGGDVQGSSITAASSMAPASKIAAATVRPAVDLSDSMAAEAVALDYLRRLSYTSRKTWTTDDASKTWNTYVSLSPATRRSLPVRDLQHILRTVVPDRTYITIFFQGHAGSERVRKIREKVARRYNSRLKTVINDMNHRIISAESSKAQPHPEADDYFFALWCMSRSGNLRATEAIYEEVKARFPESIRRRCLENRLQAALVSLQTSVEFPNPKEARAKMGLVQNLVWDVMAQLPDKELHLRRFSIAALIKVLCTAKSVFASHKSQVKSFDEAILFLLQKAFGIDMRYFTVTPTQEDTDLPITGDILKALLDHLGEKGQIWRMVSAFEALGERSARVEGMATADAYEEDDDDMGPTLSQLEQQERERGIGLSFFTAAKDIEPATTEEPVSEGAPSPRSTPTTSRYLPDITALQDLIERPLSAPSTPMLDAVQTNTYISLLKHISAAGDKGLAFHFLQVALRDAEEKSNVWLAQVLSYATQLQHQAAGDPVIMQSPLSAHAATSEAMCDQEPEARSESSAQSAVATAAPIPLPAKVTMPRVTTSPAWFLPVLRLVKNEGRQQDRERIVALLDHARLLVEREIRILSGGSQPDLAAIELQSLLAIQTPTPPLSEAEAPETLSTETSAVLNEEQAAPAVPRMDEQQLLSDVVDVTSHIEHLQRVQRVLTDQLDFFRNVVERRVAKKAAQKQRWWARRSERAEAHKREDAARQAEIEERHARRKQRKSEQQQVEQEQLVNAQPTADGQYSLAN